MWQVMWMARLLAALVGSSFETEWACWENFVPEDGPAYVCEWFQTDDDAAGLYAGVWSDGGQLEWTVEYMPGYVPETLAVVPLSPTETTVVQVEMGDAPVYYSSGGIWWEVMGPYFYGGRMDAVRVVLLPPGEGNIPFISDGDFWISIYQIPPPPDPA